MQAHREDAEDEPEPEETHEERDLEHEPWIEWLIRTTGIVEAQLGKLGLDDWVTAVRRKKWRWAGHLARRSDGRWSSKALSWQPAHGHRDRGQPCRKLVDEIDTFFLEHSGLEKRCWQILAQDRKTWEELESCFLAK